MATFEVGQRVICVWVDEKCNHLLTKGKIYTVRDVRKETGGVKLKGIYVDCFDSAYFRPDRFRPIDDTWVDDILEQVVLSEVQ